MEPDWSNLFFLQSGSNFDFDFLEFSPVNLEYPHKVSYMPSFVITIIHPLGRFHDRQTKHRSSTATRCRDNSRDRASSRPTDRYRDRSARDRSAVQSQETNKDRYWERSAHRSGDRRSGARCHGDVGDRYSRSGRASERGDGSRNRQTRGVKNSGQDVARVRSSREPFQERSHGEEHRGGRRVANGERRRTMENSEGRHESVLASGSANSKGREHERGRAGNGGENGIVGDDHSSVGANGTRCSEFSRGEGDCDFLGGFSIGSHGEGGGSQGITAKASGIVGDIPSAATSSNNPESGHESEDDVEEEQLPNHLLGKKPDFKTAGSEIAKGEIVGGPFLTVLSGA